MKNSVVWGIAALLLLGAGTAYGWRFAGQAGVGAAAIAKVTCSCVFVDGRDAAACRAEEPPGFEAVQTEVDAAGKSVTAHALMIVTRRATYHPDYGCTLQP